MIRMLSWLAFVGVSISAIGAAMLLTIGWSRPTPATPATPTKAATIIPDFIPPPIEAHLVRTIALTKQNEPAREQQMPKGDRLDSRISSSTFANTSAAPVTYQQPAAAPPILERQAHFVEPLPVVEHRDVCAKYGGHRVDRGRSWHCVYPRRHHR